jgi:hypothetical protein
MISKIEIDNSNFEKYVSFDDFEKNRFLGTKIDIRR